MQTHQGLGRPLTGRAVLIWLLAFFSIVIAVNMVMMRLAAQTLPGTAVDSAYRASLAYQSEIEAARVQTELDWHVNVDVVRAESGRVQINLVGRDRRGEFLRDVSFNTKLERPTSNRLDHLATLDAAGKGLFQSEIPDVERGQWDLTIEGTRDGVCLFRSVHRVIFE